MEVEMGEPARQLEQVVEVSAVTQYWVCQEVDIFRVGHHVYEINGRNYVVMAYPIDRRFATAICSKGRMIAIVEVHDYNPKANLAHKENWTFLAWILTVPPKRLS